MTDRLVIADVEVGGTPGRTVVIERGRIVAIGAQVSVGGGRIDGGGGALLPGLHDHHLHLFALAALAASIDLFDAAGPDDVAYRLAAGARPGEWLRAFGYHEATAGPLDRARLDAIVPGSPVRVQHQTGSLWLLNSAALALVARGDLPDAVERGLNGAPTGRIWRGDAWLRERIGSGAPSLAPLGRQLARLGVTGVTDATPATDAAAAALIAAAHRAGDVPQRVTLMSAGPLVAPNDGAFSVGPVKIVLDDRDLLPLDELARRLANARRWGRAIAVHCVTDVQLALTLAALSAVGACAGDRIEHGGMITAEAIPELRAFGLTVVTQPGFVEERGERFLADTPEERHGDLYRCASLMAAGVAVAGSSDAPYGDPDPWRIIRAAAARRTRAGRTLGADERVTSATALAMFSGRADLPGRPRRVAVGEPADLCLLRRPLSDALDAPDADLVKATIIGGRVVHHA